MLEKIIKDSDLKFKDELLPSWLKPVIKNNFATIKSYSYSSEKCRRIRISNLEIKGKFKAETIIIYPKFCYETPIFGSEYMIIKNKKYFYAIDFHPIKNDQNYNQKYILNYLFDYPDSQKQKSKFYDLEKYFSKKLKFFSSLATEVKDENNFMESYKEYFLEYLNSYKKCLDDSEETHFSFYEQQKEYDLHMGLNDPAYGILKNYFSEDFAKKYISEFLFELINT